jgi:2-polyprenyl-6-methoxyphenol hydroxylase-like FAD-dependent oxidoreductase
MTRPGTQALVLGGSLGGIIAARVLSEVFEQVTVIERDATPALGDQRKGVPQGRHAHGLLYAGRDALERLFPGWTDEVVRHGGVIGRGGRDGRFIHHGHLQARVDAPAKVLLASRPLIEGTLRACLLRRPGVRWLERTEVLSPLSSEDGRSVLGAHLRDPDGTERTFRADLVVDALGRGSPTPRWLRQLGYPEPRSDEVRVNIHYTTRLFRRTPGALGGDLYVLVASNPPNPRSAAVLAIEGNLFIVTLAGALGERAPTDLEGFRAYARDLPAPDVAQLLDDATPVGEAVTGTFPASVRRHYERLRRFPKGYLLFGDALASFNPVFGQGMTVAALEGLALAGCLAGGLEGLPRRFLSCSAKLVDIPWGTAVLNDLRFPEVSGARSGMVRFLHRYLPRLYERGRDDPLIARKVLEVVNLGAPPATLLAPRVAWRALRPRPRRRPLVSSGTPAPSTQREAPGRAQREALLAGKSR